MKFALRGSEIAPSTGTTGWRCTKSMGLIYSRTASPKDANTQHLQTCKASGHSVNAIAAPERLEELVQSGPESGQRGPPTQAAIKSAFSTEKPEQQDTTFELDVEGKIPTWLKGCIVRNGPGIFHKDHVHLFDGYAMLVKFEFDNGKVKTQQKFVLSNSYKEFERTGEPQYDEFGSQVPLRRSLKHLVGSFFGAEIPITDNSSVNTYRAQGEEEITTMTEVAHGCYKVDPDSLDTLGRLNFKDDVSGDLTTAHPVIYPDGRIYNLYTDVGKGRCIAEISGNIRRKVASIPLDSKLNPPWVHDLPGTENYVIVPDTPNVFSLQGLLYKNATYTNFEWKPDVQKTQFHLVNRHTGDVKTVKADFDFFTFHYANAFESEDGEYIYVDCPIFEDPELVNSLRLDKMRSGEKSIAETSSVFSRISIPLKGGQASAETIVPQSQCLYLELMRVNPNFKFKDYSYVYGVSARLPTSYGNALSKLDVKKGTAKQWFEPGCITTEPLMIPRPDSTTEDDGVVTSLVTGSDGKSFLLVLDAASFKELGRAKLPYGITYGFHNQFYQ